MMILLECPVLKKTRAALLSTYNAHHHFYLVTDMGVGQPDDSQQIDPSQQPALNTSRLVLKQLDQTDMVLHIGDISYARGYAGVVSGPALRRVYRSVVILPTQPPSLPLPPSLPPSLPLSLQWDDFMAEIQPIATRVPYMVCIGNHERDYPNSG